MLWSALKDVIAGFSIGVFAVFARSKVALVLWGLLAGLGLAHWVAMQPDPDTGKNDYLAIMLPGGCMSGETRAHKSRSKGANHVRPSQPDP